MLYQTQHAQKRKIQRGFSDFAISIILNYGLEQKTAHGPVKINLPKREKRKIILNLKHAIKKLE